MQGNDKPRIVPVSEGSIVADGASWRLIGQNGSLREVLLEATPHLGLVYRDDLGERLGLPNNGVLRPDRIEYVAAKWLPDMNVWTLGVSILPEWDTGEKPRWCELTRLPSGGRPDDVDSAGRALANVLDVPFHVVNAPASPSERQETMPLPVSFPLRLGDFEVVEAPEGLLLRRSGRWLRGCLSKLATYPILTFMYALFSIKELTSPYAQNEAEWLPVAGLLIALWLLAAWVRSWTTLLRASDVILNTAEMTACRVGTVSRLLGLDPSVSDCIRLDGDCGLIAYQTTKGERDEWELLFNCRLGRPWHIVHVVEKPEGGIPLAVQTAHVLAASLHLPLRVRRM